MNPAEPVQWQGRTCTRAEVRRELRGRGMAPELVKGVAEGLPTTRAAGSCARRTQASRSATAVDHQATYAHVSPRTALRTVT